MDPVLAQIVRRVQQRAKANPPEDAAVSPDTDLQLEILRSGRIPSDFDESDLMDAAAKIGISEEDIPGWIDSLASWT